MAGTARKIQVIPPTFQSTCVPIAILLDYSLELVQDVWFASWPLRRLLRFPRPGSSREPPWLVSHDESHDPPVSHVASGHEITPSKARELDSCTVCTVMSHGLSEIVFPTVLQIILLQILSYSISLPNWKDGWGRA
jgi:hypothetical protein